MFPGKGAFVAPFFVIRHCIYLIFTIFDTIRRLMCFLKHGQPFQPKIGCFEQNVCLPRLCGGTRILLIYLCVKHFSCSFHPDLFLKPKPN